MNENSLLLLLLLLLLLSVLLKGARDSLVG
jgi:hypothetical protein